LNRSKVYWSANALFCIILAIGASVGSVATVHPLYLLLLFAQCSTPIFNVEKFNDRYGLLVLFSAMYFHFFGTLDLTHLYQPVKDAKAIDGVISMTEAVILVGGAIFQVAYRFACKDRSLNQSVLIKDWPEATLLKVGIPLWIIASILNWQFKVNIISDTTSWAIEYGLASLNSLQQAIYMLATMLQPLGMMIIAYAYCRYKRPYMLLFVFAVVMYQVIIGFVMDGKIEVIMGAAIVLAAFLFIEHKLPLAWLMSSIVFVALAFPALQANRNLRGLELMTHREAAQNLISTIKKSLELGKQVKSGDIEANSFSERTSMKGSVQLIVTRTGHGVPYQHGYTLIPIPAAFIPRILWPSKPDIPTGRLMNKEFQVSTVDYTYISPSHLGELYWNFGWLGVISGMSLIGMLFGLLGRRIDMSSVPSMTKFMIAAVTIKSLIMGFESSIAVMYVVWIRSMAAIGILHLLLSRYISSNPADKQTSIAKTNTTLLNNDHPNLLR
jgi:hypothetical protein